MTYPFWYQLVIVCSLRSQRDDFIRYTISMADSGMIASVGITGDSYDNALAETVNGYNKSEVIYYLKENWTGVNDVELTTIE